MSQVDLLYRLQQIDNEIQDGKRRLGQIARLLQGNAELAAASQKLAALTKAQLAQRTGQQDLNLELAALDDKARRSERRLYSGQVKNPKELSDLQHELQSLGRRRAILEDDLLEAMILLEETDAEVDEARRSHDRLEADWAEKRVDLEREQREILEGNNEAQRQREELLRLVAPQSLSAYETVQRRVSGQAVVLLKQGRCLGCQLQVPAHQAKAVDEGQLVHCDSCGRILSAA